MSQSHPESPSLPTVIESDLDSIPGVEIGTRIVAFKIDPRTGVRDPEVEGDFSGVVVGGRYAQSKIGVHRLQPLRVLREGDGTPSHTSCIDCINRMSDGSYWLHTLGKSVYVLRIVGQVDTTRFRGDADIARESEQQIGSLRHFFRALIKFLCDSLQP